MFAHHHHPIRFDNGWIDDVEMGKRIQKRGKGMIQCEFDSELIQFTDRISIGNPCPTVGRWSLQAQHSLPAIDNRIGVYRTAVVESGILFELEGKFTGIWQSFDALHQIVLQRIPLRTIKSAS